MERVLDEKEKQLLIKVRDLMFRLGIKSLTMDDIAQQLGISKKTIYQVVENKADLVNKVIEYTIEENMHQCMNFFDGKLNAIDEMALIYQYNGMMAKKINPSLLFELKKYFPESWDVMEKFKSDFIQKNVERNLKEGMASGLYRQNMNVEIISRLYSSRVLDVFAIDLFPTNQFTPDQILKEMFVYHIRGIASAAGIAYLENNTSLAF